VISPPLEKVDGWYTLTANARDGKLAIAVNGRGTGEETLPAPHQPWLGFHAATEGDSSFRNLKIGGQPVVPEEVLLSSRETLNGWFPFCGEQLSDQQADWIKQCDEIQSRSRKVEAVDRQESMLQYSRPLVEDGELRYEFFYQKDEAAVHPALDRLAFLIRPQGVGLHWVTDGPSDQTMLSPGHVVEEAENRRGPEALPLKENDWNAMKLTLQGDSVAITLNGVEVFVRKLPAGNRRLFGLFLYADEGQARVRNVVYRGNWAREIPAHFAAQASSVDSAPAAAED
jgi:hypothetical protein